MRFESIPKVNVQMSTTLLRLVPLNAVGPVVESSLKSNAVIGSFSVTTNHNRVLGVSITDERLHLMETNLYSYGRNLGLKTLVPSLTNMLQKFAKIGT